MSDAVPLQDQLIHDAPIRNCYGCGADNPKGFQIKSRLEGDEGICQWRPQQHHCSYPGYLNGGVACTLIDCHSVWTAFALECRDRGADLDEPDLPTGWTKTLNVEFLKPARLDAELVVRARVIRKGRTSRTIACSIYVNGEEHVRAEVIAVLG
ncbi:MAG: PaaI family thioesterase [Deltaproteobacteria bacterium]|nr:PaaI family thioesterase [Deltaproteobacteria bacterium]